MEECVSNPKNWQAGEGSMDLAGRLERVMLAITFAEMGKHQWAQKVLSELDESRRHSGKTVLADKFSAIEFYLESLCERCVKIEKNKFFSTKHYSIFVKDLEGQVRHHLIFAFQFLARNTLLEIIEKLISWHLEDVLRKAGKNVVLVSDEGLYVPCLGRLNL
jgi:hypothetical protein